MKYDISLEKDAEALDTALGDETYCVIYDQDLKAWEVVVEGNNITAGALAYDVLVECLIESYPFHLN